MRITMIPRKLSHLGSARSTYSNCRNSSLLPSSLTMEAKWSLFGFCSAIILWTTTTINSAYIALGSVLFLIISGTAKQDLLFDSLASDVIWLMIGSFILGRALQITGLAEK